MNGPRIGSLFSGAGMLDEGVRAVLGGSVAWHSEVDPAACKVLAHRYPDVPNLGDVTTVDWSQVEPIDVITGGSPCQDVSHAGKRAGMRAGTRSGLWAAMVDAIDILRPQMVIWENVRGVLSAEADSALEPCAGCVGDGDDGAVLRALGRVLGDLAELGYDTQWRGLRASDVGAPHGRFRVFVVATDANNAGRREHCGRLSNATELATTQRIRAIAPDAACDGRNEGRLIGRPHAAQCSATPTPDAASVGLDGSTRPDTEPDRRGQRTGRADTHGRNRASVTDAPSGSGSNRQECGSPAGQHERPVTRAGSGDSAGHSPSRVHDVGGTAAVVAWGVYEPAIRRWERLTRPAPAPTETGPKGGQRLSPRFTEWMMGWPDGWVTDTPGVSRNDALKICGNGVVWLQAAEALRRILATSQAVAA